MYERYLLEHKKSDDCPDVALLLAAKYTRDLQNKDRALELLEIYASSFSSKHAALIAALTAELPT